MPPKKYKSRRGKKNQRKNTDISDLENHLEEQRSLALIGGAPDERKDDQLFFIDVRQDAEVEEVKQTKVQYYRSKELYVDKALKPNPFVPQFHVDHSKKPGITKSTKKQVSKIIKSQNQPSQESNGKKKTTETETENVYDIWDAPPKKHTAKVMVVKKRKVGSNKVVKETVEVDIDENDYLEVLKPREIKPHLRKTPGNIPAVELPKPGTSYNPSVDDHQDLLGEAVAQAIRLTDEEEQLNRKIKPSAETLKNLKEQNLKEVVSDNEEDEEANEDDMKVDDGETKGTPDNRKTKTERNKERRKKEASRLDKLKRTEKRKLRDIEQLPTIVESINEEEESKKEKRDALKVLKSENKNKVNKKFQDIPIPVLLTEELPSSLRQLQSNVVNPIREQFLSMEKRNMLDKKKGIKRGRRYALKVFDKRGMDDVSSLLSKEL